MMKHIVDKGLNKLISRKLMAWGTATCLFGIWRLGYHHLCLYWRADCNRCSGQAKGV